MSFVNVLAIQLKKFNQNFYLNAFTLLLNNQRAICPLRSIIIESFIKLTSHFTEGAYTHLLREQNIVSEIKFGIYNEKKDINNAIKKLSEEVKDVISFDKIDPSLLFFHEKEGQGFSIITNKQKEDEEYIKLLKLKNSQVYQIKELPNYKNYKQKQFLEEMKEILDINIPVEKNKENNGQISLEEIAGDYVFTPDNFVKMVLILIRIRSGIPVIMMGETGCGKTSLIRMLSQMQNKGEKNGMKILNIHAGTNDDDIIKFMNEFVIPEAKLILESEKNIKEERLRNNQTFENKKVWVFLDEINTCKSMGLISELMCKRTCQGVSLPENIVFIAACNPYRIREKKTGIKEVGLNINQAKNQMKQLNHKEQEEIRAYKGNDLVYTVNPLPHSLLNFVFYFGQLKSEDEKNYINCIIRKVIEKIYYNGITPLDEKDEDEKIKNLKKLACDLIWAAQEYIREKNDKSAVSLREVRRVNIFYEFFYNYFNSKKELYLDGNHNEIYEEDSEFYKNLDKYDMQICAINLSIFVNYYLRITNKEQRKELVEKLNKILFNFKLKVKDFLDLPLKEEKFIVNNIKLDKGIATNRALLENIFSLFVAINSKVPIFIVGKPGCSKSLSMQLITKSMQGTASEMPFFKKLPRIIIQSYQGSLASTSKGVENVFKKARETLRQIKKVDNDDIISLIYFDEMGLAEHSPNNPLKVLHGELEYDQNENDKQIAFVGISNWNLDAAKMNRGISISIPEPDEEDNKETAFTIGNSYNEVMAQRYKTFFENLGKSYYDYKAYLKERYSFDGKDDFHGNRDFYHLVKNSARNMIEKENTNSLNEQTLLESAIDSIERNFSGIQFNENQKASLEIYKEIFHKIYPTCQIKKEYDVLKRIKENINDLNSRYLLIASESSIGTFLLSSILEGENKRYNFYIGSPFEQDLNSEEYVLKVLNRIQAYMENGNILILKNLESVYPSLYDLFNQNFTVISKKHYSRLAVGSNTNSFAYVHKDFRCIVNVETGKLDEEEAPFLNRFEKHIMSFEYMMNQELIRVAEKIKNNIDGFFKCNKKFKAINYDLTKLMINCGKEEIQALVYDANKKGIKKENISDYVLEKIAMTLPQDILVNLKLAGTKQENNLKTILKYYGKGEHTNFYKFLENVQNQKNIIYTFTGYLEDVIKDNDLIKNNLVGDIKKENIKIIQLNSIQSEREFEMYISEYLNDDNKKLCIIKFLPFEGSFMNYIKHFIESKISGIKPFENKLFIFIVYMTRISLKEISDLDKKTPKEKEIYNQKILTETLSNLSGFYQIFIDNLKGNPKFKFDQIVPMKKEDLFKTLLNPDEELSINIFKSISYLKYNISSSYKGLSKENYVEKLIEFISSNSRLRDLINKKIFTQLFTKNEDIINKVFSDAKAFKGGEIEILSVIKTYLSKLYTTQLSLFYLKAEKDQFFSALLCNNIDEKIWPKIKGVYEDKTIIEKAAKIYLENFVYDGKTSLKEKVGANSINIFLGIKLPGIKPIFDGILSSLKENKDIKIDLRQYEDKLRNYIDQENIEETKNNFYDNLLNNNNSLSVLISKDERLKNILNICQNNEDEDYELNKLLIDDYYSYFLHNNLNKSINNQEIQENIDENKTKNENFENNIKYFYLLLDIRNKILEEFFGKNNNCPNTIQYKLATIMNWVEYYPVEISSLQKIFFKLNNNIPNFYEKIKSILSSDQITYEISERNPEYTAIVNKVFFLGLDSILRIITSKPEIYELLKDDEFSAFIRTTKEVLQNALQLESSLNLKSKEVLSLQEIHKIFNALNLNKLDNIKNVKKIIQYFHDETIILKTDSKDKLCNTFINFYKTLEKWMVNKPSNKFFNYDKFISLILLDEFTKIPYDEFRELILDQILKKDGLIKNSSQIINIIIDNVGISGNPDEIGDNIEYIKDNDSKMFQKLNITKNSFLEEVIMNIFERKLLKYFELIPTLNEELLEELYKTYFEQNQKTKNKTGIIFDNSFTVFESCIKILDSISKSQKQNNEENTNLLKLYCIVYVKLYLYHMTNFLFDDFEQMKSIKEIIDCINNLSNKDFSKVIKIYILKLFYNLNNNNYDDFSKFDYEKRGITFYKEFADGKNSKEINLTYFFLPSEPSNFEKYNKILSSFVNNTNFDINDRELETQLDKYGLDLFLLFTLNRIISNLSRNDFENNDIYKNFCKYAKTLFDKDKKPKFSKELCQLLSLFFDTEIYKTKTKAKINNGKRKIDLNLFEALLYGFRFCVNSLYFEDDKKNDIQKLFYPSLLMKDCEKAISTSLIPGNDYKEDLHLISLDSINFHFENYNEEEGCFVCDCGCYYYIGKCGFPTVGRTFNCSGCGNKIGWGPKVIPDKGAKNHGMVIRDGHYRIFKNLEQKKKQMGKWNDPDENIPNILLDDYIKQVIDPIRSNPGCGFNIVNKDYFEQRDKKIRKLTNIGYRLLNFISYCHLFYSYCLGNLNDKQLEKYLIKECDILEIIQIDWNLLKEALQLKNVGSIQIFINIIFDDLSKLIKEYNITKNIKDRDIFETKVEELISQTLKKYPKNNKIYIEENKKQSDSDIKSLKTYVTELIHPSSDNYSDKEYPMFKYFNYTKYKSERDMLERMDDKKKYSLIKQLVSDSPEVKKLAYLEDFNEFTNYMVDYYTFKISREDARNRILKNEDIVNEKEFKKKFKKFCEAWAQIKKEATKYICRPEMEVKQGFSTDDKLISLLNDRGELYNGMYLASACQNFIQWQNTFLQPIIDNNPSDNDILNIYLINLLRKVPVQEANHDQIVLIKERFEKYGKYIDFNDFIYAFSERNIFGENGKINYLDYNTIVYDYDRMEEELGKIILPGVCLFENENMLNFVTYWGEGFRDRNTDLMSKLYMKYKQKDLNNDEKKIVIDYITNINKSKSENPENKKNYDFKNFFGSMIMLIFYLAQKTVINEEETINDVIEKAPNYLQLSDDCKNFFSKEGKNYTLNKIANLYFFFEHACFEDLVDTLQPEYKKQIPEETKNKIIEKLIKQQKPDDKINTQNLAAATRRLISRYLAGNFQFSEFKVDGPITDQLSREDLWEEKIRQLNNLEELIVDKLFEFNLTLQHIYEFYNLIGDEDRNSLKINN